MIAGAGEVRGGEQDGLSCHSALCQHRSAESRTYMPRTGVLLIEQDRGFVYHWILRFDHGISRYAARGDRDNCRVIIGQWLQDRQYRESLAHGLTHSPGAIGAGEHKRPAAPRFVARS